MTKPRKKKYFPNNYEAIAGAPAEWFQPISYEDFMDWKIAGYEIPSSIACIIRETNLTNGKIKEHVYSRHADAKKKAVKIMAEGVSEFVIATAEELHYMRPEYVEEYDDPLN